jgi:hypothetical protein
MRPPQSHSGSRFDGYAAGTLGIFGELLSLPRTVALAHNVCGVSD